MKIREDKNNIISLKKLRKVSDRQNNIYVMVGVIIITAIASYCFGKFSTESNFRNVVLPQLQQQCNETVDANIKSCNAYYAEHPNIQRVPIYNLQPNYPRFTTCNAFGNSVNCLNY